MALQEQTRNAWDGVAENYDQYVTPIVTPLAEEVLGRVDVRSGARLLDVAAGTGALSIPAARLGAHVTATDIAPAMIQRLRARAGAENLTELHAQTMDALDLEFEDATFDIAASQLGVTVVPDFGRGLAEMARVTKPGGKVLIAALGPPQSAEFLGLFLAALKATVPGFPDPSTGPPPPQFQVADPATFRQRLDEAGLADITVEPVTFGLTFSSSASLWGFLMGSNPIGPTLVAPLSERQRDDLKAVLDGMLRERASGQHRATLNLDVNIGTATRP